MFVISGSSLFFSVTDNSFLSPATGDTSPHAGLLTLSLSSILFYIRYLFLVSLAALFACFTMLITGKRLFNEVFTK